MTEKAQLRAEDVIERLAAAFLPTPCAAMFRSGRSLIELSIPCHFGPLLVPDLVVEELQKPEVLEGTIRRIQQQVRDLCLA
ncbi:hypothetical protein VQH23_16340 [Pararoseomonas sp. SCSIO 73927]|uniref:hypothetical protein n=1 Tax=Pararoseomonas sp. SCSIO 73927 TaxID=3114537 RepID=UPI0030D3427B